LIKLAKRDIGKDLVFLEDSDEEENECRPQKRDDLSQTEEEVLRASIVPCVVLHVI